VIPMANVTYRVVESQVTHGVVIRDIKDAPPISRSYRLAPLSARSARLEYERIGEGPYELVYIWVSGVLLKKNGTPGDQQATDTWLSSEVLAAPEWLLEMANQNLPAWERV